MSKPVTVPEAARQIGKDVSTLRRWMRQGCPVVDYQGRGRGNRTLVDVDAILAWRQRHERHTDLSELADKIPDLIAGCVIDAFAYAESLGYLPKDRSGCAFALSFAWKFSAQLVLDELREMDPDVGELDTVPDILTHLVKLGTK